MLQGFVSIVDEMPGALKKMVVGHCKSMDITGIYSHDKQGDMKRAAQYIGHAFKQMISEKLKVGT